MKKPKYYPSQSSETFSFDHVHTEFDKQVPLHQQETWELAYIITGSGIRTIGNVVENFSEGEIILIPPDVPHCWSFDKNIHDREGKIENICIFFKSKFLSDLENFYPEFGKNLRKIEENKNALSFHGETLKKLQKLLKLMSSQNGIERLSSFLLILNQVSSSESTNIVAYFKEKKNEDKLHEIYMFVLNQSHRAITLDEVAQIAGMPKSTFCLFFKKMTGKSFVTYLIEFRIESSCQMLIKTQMSVSEICITTGFNDIPYFNRIFKKIKEKTPTEYRKTHLLIDN
ncbi:AraC family transcriptional regulator [Chryseobacterium sp. LC2016-27]|uniref:AraC family transcriptional regulator n=1 Tax=Chryseobacterium sp. LC2016-27 TaxID=2897326 RepID=UPI001E435924|nr:AraC family transcriptional regulator [Chryseobacterium sp. LC2016-27]MCD0454635.1 AraC family transcriptional regulator [Chryseobacterium sp. LC2016-27]